MNLADVAMIFAFLGFSLYIVLDGYDLGIGVLTLFNRDNRRRRQMHALVAWLWDGNESWLVLTALIAWTAVPLAFGVALPALYLPLMLMLFALIARGFAIEMVDQYPGWHRFWGPLFGLGSLVAALCQGAAFGAVIAGINVQGTTFVGGPFTFLHGGYAVLTGLTAVALYCVAGSAWVYFKSDPGLRRWVSYSGRIAIVALAVGTAPSWLLAQDSGPVVLHPFDAVRLPIWVAGAVILAAGLAFGFVAFSGAPNTGEVSRRPVLATLGMYVGGLAIAAGLVYPVLVPPSITVHSAASPQATLVWLLIACGIIVPVTIAYQALGYWVFGRRVKEYTAA